MTAKQGTMKKVKQSIKATFDAYYTKQSVEGEETINEGSINTTYINEQVLPKYKENDENFNVIVDIIYQFKDVYVNKYQTSGEKLSYKKFKTLLDDFLLENISNNLRELSRNKEIIQKPTNKYIEEFLSSSDDINQVNDYPKDLEDD